MFDIGFWELLVIGVIALIVVGPERLPGVLRTIGLWVGRARAATASIRDEVEREVNAQGLRDTQRALRKETQDLERDLSEATRPVEQSVREAEGATREAAREAEQAARQPDDAAEPRANERK